MNLKKGMSFLCSAALAVSGIFSGLQVSAAAGEDNFSDETAVSSNRMIRGDVNLDGKVDQSDASLIIKELLSLDTSGKSVLCDYVDTEIYRDYTEEVIYYLGDVDNSDSGRSFTLTDGTMILRAVLEADLAGEETVTDEIWNKVTGVDYSYAAFLWLGDSFKYNDRMIFSGLDEDSDIADITFRVKENVSDGCYDLKFYNDMNHSSTFCDDDVNGYIPEAYDGVIGVNCKTEQVQYGDEFSFITGSASVKPGDTFTVTCSVKNLPVSIVALNCYIRYDRNIFELISVEAADDIKDSGEFVSSAGNSRR